MAKKLYEEQNIYDIACAIREKCGDQKAKFKTCDMADAIRDLEIGGGGGGTGEGGIPTPIVFEGQANNMFNSPIWNSFIENYGDQLTITTEQLFDMFAENVWLTDASNLTITVNEYSNPTPDNPANPMSRMFYSCLRLTDLPTIEGDCKPIELRSFFNNCWSLQNVTTKFFRYFDWSHMEQYTQSPTLSDNGLYPSYNGFASMLTNCYSLRKFPLSIFSHDCPTRINNRYWDGLKYLCAMDELSDLPIPYNSASTIKPTYCTRLSEFTFEMDEDDEGNEIPMAKNWSNATVDLTTYIGYGNSTTEEYLYNWAQDFNDANKVTSALTYAELKDDPDWHTTDINFSRYNHDSAYQTILSLPDTNASTTGGNVIKFKSGSGAATDGGPISALTESEIAVAAIKGWTVTLVD